MVTRKDVARKAGVSTATVSNVFGKRLPVSEKIVKKVMLAAEELHYIPNHTARCLSLGRTNHIGVIINEFINPFFMEIVKHIENYVKQRGFMVTVFDIKEGSGNDSFLSERQFDALINFSMNIYSKDLLRSLELRGTKMVNFTDVKSMSFGHSYDNAMEELMLKLSSLGHKKVGYIATIDKERWLDDGRGKCFLKMRSVCGFEENDEYLVFNNDYSLTSDVIGYENCIRLFEKHRDITAVFVTNDLAAIGVLRALKDMGLDCPNDVSVIGCDDIMVSKLYSPSITTLSFDKELYGTDIAKRVVDAVLNGTDYTEEEYTINSVAVLRESVAKAK